MPLRNQLVVNVDRRIRRQREPHSFKPAAARINRGVDSDYLAGQTYQRAAGISRIDRRIRLNKILELRVPDVLPVRRADDSRRHGAVQRKRAAERQHPVANFRSFRIPQSRNRQIVPRVDFDHREIRLLIKTDHLPAVMRRITVDGHLNFRRAVNHVIVRQDVPSFVHDHARTQALFGLWSLRRARVLAEILVEEILEWVLPAGPCAALVLRCFEHLRCRNIHHGRLDARDDIRKTVRQINRVGNRKQHGAIRISRTYRRHFSGNQRTYEDSYAEGQRKQDARKNLPVPHPRDQFQQLNAHCCSLRPRPRFSPGWKLEYITSLVRCLSTPTIFPASPRPRHLSSRPAMPAATSPAAPSQASLEPPFGPPHTHLDSPFRLSLASRN